MIVRRLMIQILLLTMLDAKFSQRLLKQENIDCIVATSDAKTLLNDKISLNIRIKALTTNGSCC